jgi:hypothetical protein
LNPDLDKIHPVNKPIHITYNLDSIPNTVKHVREVATAVGVEAPKVKGVLLVAKYWKAYAGHKVYSWGTRQYEPRPINALNGSTFNFYLVFDDEDVAKIAADHTRNDGNIRSGVIWESGLCENGLPVHTITQEDVPAIRKKFDELMAGL